MALVKWEPKAARELEPFRGLRGEMERMFDEFAGSWPLRRLGQFLAPAEGVILPSVDVEETEQEVILRAELPGIRKEDLEVDVAEQQVTIKGERKEERVMKDTTFYQKENTYGSFLRRLELPASVVPEKAAGKLENGILTLTLPKAESAKPKSVKVNLG